jgi:hypothetical protein
MREYVDEPICALCGKVKAPAGRSVAAQCVVCHPYECDGYMQPPYASAYFKGETEEERNIF